MIIAIVVLASVAAYQQSELSRTTITTTTATTTSTTWMTYTSVDTLRVNSWPLVYVSDVSPDGLQLTVRLNSSVLQPRGDVGAEVLLTNVLNRNVSLAVVPDQNLSQWSSLDYLCGAGNPFLGFALFAGHYSVSNISAAGQPLQVGVPAGIPCVSPPLMGVNSTTFLPDSDLTVFYTPVGRATINATAEVSPATTYCAYAQGLGSCPLGSGLFGYWNPSVVLIEENSTLASKYFSYFPPGEYTLVAADDWSQYVYAYFTVL